MDRYHRCFKPPNRLNLDRVLWRMLPRSVRVAVAARLRAIM